MTRFIRKLCGEEDALLLCWSSGQVRDKRVDDTDFALEKDHKAADPDRAVLFGYTSPVLAVNTEVQVLGTPLLFFPAMIEFAIARKVDKFIIYLSDNDAVTFYLSKLMERRLRYVESHNASSPFYFAKVFFVVAGWGRAWLPKAAGPAATMQPQNTPRLISQGFS